MEQEISLVEMTEQIIGKEAEKMNMLWSWSHLCLVSRLSDFFSAFVVVVFFVRCCRCVYTPGEFESRYGDLRQGSADLMESYFRAAENAENVYFEQTSTLIGDLLEQFGDDKLPDDVTDECRGLLADREILINSCATSHDTHLSKLLTVEEGLRNRGNQETLNMISTYKSNEWIRNRSAIMEIRKLNDLNLAKIDVIFNRVMDKYDDMYQDDDDGQY